MAGSTGYKVTNPLDRDIILNQFEGETFIVPAGKSIRIDNQRAALTLKDAGAVLSQETYERAANDEAHAEVGRRNADGTDPRNQRRDRTGSGAPTVVNPNPVAPVGAQEEPLVPVVPSDTAVSEPHKSVTIPEELVDGDPAGVELNPDAEQDAADVEELKGTALDDALEALSLPKTGTADEKRKRLADANAAAAAQDGNA